ncbi:MAG: cytochrome P450 [Pseudonocardia sp.]|nr:cytochrome P450 [Pseudonocardia sp.]
MATPPVTNTPSNTTAKGAAGPGWLATPRFWALLLRDPIRGLMALRTEYGDAVRLPFGHRHTFLLLSRPEHAEHVLVTHQHRYVKAFTYRPLRAFLGDGLLTSEGETWQRHRRLVQPVFSRRHVGRFAPAMAEAAGERTAGWAERGSVDLAGELRTLTMDIVGRVLFGARLADDSERISRAVTGLQDSAIYAAYLPGTSPRTRRALAGWLIPGVGSAAGTLDQLVDSVIEQRLAHPHDTPTDLLDLLIADPGSEPLTTQEVRDEVSTLVLAGHETTANALAWTFTLLSRYPAAREQLHKEVDEVLAGRAPDAADVDKLTWTNAVINEAMRLYPPAWTIERDAVEDDDVAGVPVPTGASVVISPFLLHRDPDLWPNPEGFDPQRFLPGHTTNRPKYAYLPFGGGRRICVGGGFAQLEAALILATVAARYRLDLAPGARVTAKAGVTLHPDGAVPMTVSKRAI